jgi:hypothetical protein
MGLLGDLFGVIGDIGSLVQQKRVLDLAESQVEVGQYWRNVGFQGLQGSIQRRQQAYNDIWKMVYGGVEGNYDFDAMYANIQGRGSTVNTEKREQSVTGSDYADPRTSFDPGLTTDNRRDRSSMSLTGSTIKKPDENTTLQTKEKHKAPWETEQDTSGHRTKHNR